MELENRFKSPEGWEWNNLTSSNGRHIRYGRVLPENPEAIVVMCPGISEYGEKYFEFARDMLKRNYGFYVIDWYGQGKSGRYIDSDKDKRHSDSFDLDLKDLHSLVSQKVTPEANGLPLILVAHSMGGNMAMRYLVEHPNIFKGAAFSAPMFGIKIFSSLPNGLSGFITSMHKSVHEKYVYGGGDSTQAINDRNKNNYFTHDKERFKIHNYWMEKDDELRIGHPTFGWVHNALNSCTKLFDRVKNNPPEIPVLIALAKKEKLVSRSKMREMAEILPNAKLIELNCFHEIIMETDDIRNQFLASFDDLSNKIVLGCKND